MATTHKWIIGSLESYPEKDGRKDVVFRVHWHRAASNGAKSTDTFGAQTIDLDPAAPFTPYENLTEPQIVAWLESAIGSAGIKEIKTFLDAQLAEIPAEIPVVKPLPWA